MTISREAQRRKDWRDRHQLDADTTPVPGVAQIPAQPARQRPLCIVQGCHRVRQAHSQLCAACDRETDPQ